MPAAPYWRVVVDATNNGRWVVFSEVAFMDALGNDLSIGGQALASSFYAAGFEAQKAFDKNIADTSRWSNSDYQFPAWIGYRHSQPVDVSYVRLVCDTSVAQGDAQLPRRNADVHIQWSLDGQTWFAMAKHLVVHDGAWKNSTVIWISEIANAQLVCTLSQSGVAYAAPVEGGVQMALLQARTAQDVEFGGPGVYPFKVEGLPTSQRARVTLLRARDRMVARETWSAADGNGQFTGLDLNTKFIALAQDPAGLLHPCGAEHFPELPKTVGGA